MARRKAIYSFFITSRYFREICQGNISPALLWGGLKCCVVTLCYGLIIYLVSLVIRLIRKPRL